MKKLYLKFFSLLLLAAVALPLVSCFKKEDNKAPVKYGDCQFDGIDVSHHQGKIDWEMVAKDSRVKFVYIKATEGSTHKDSNYERNIKHAQKQGLKCGSYHYFTMHSKAQAQFDNFKATTKSYVQDLIPMIDIELNGKDKDGWMIDGCHTGPKVPHERERVILTLEKLVKMFEEEYGCKPILYCSYASYVQLLCDDFADYPIFLGNFADKPRIDDYFIWQFTEKGHIAGIEGAVDLERFHSGINLAHIELKKAQPETAYYASSKSSEIVEINETDSLIVFNPNFGYIDLVTGKMPDKFIDTNVVFCCAAAYTRQRLDVFSHNNIAGDHVSSGKRYSGYSCPDNTGAFVWFDGRWKFLWKFYSHEFDIAEKHQGMGFGQEMMIHEGDICQTTRSDNNGPNSFRALCEVHGSLCVIDSKIPMVFGDFKRLCQSYGAKEALYLDSGPGWNHSWHRNDKGDAVDIFPKEHDYCTNWLTFYR